MTPEIPIEGKTAAVKAAKGSINAVSKAEERRIIPALFSRLTPAEQALAVVCPVCKAGCGTYCYGEKEPSYDCPSGMYSLPSHYERIALVSCKEQKYE